MKKKIIKIIEIIIIGICIFNMYIPQNTCYALSDVSENIDIWIRNSEDGEEKIIGKLEPVLKFIRGAGVTVSACTLAIIAMKIIFGSVDEKASYKQTLIPWATGAVMIFAMTTLPTMIYNFVGEENMESEEIKISSGTVKIAYECPVHKMELLSSNSYKCSVEGCEYDNGWYCPTHEKKLVNGKCSEQGCDIVVKDAVMFAKQYRKCPTDSCGKKVYELFGNWYCPGCHKFYEKKN